MNKKQELINIITHDFDDENIIKSFMDLIEYFLSKKNPSNLKSLSFVQIQNITKTNIEETHQIILYLLGDRVNLLITEFRFYDETTDELYTLNDEDIELIKTENVYYHPETDVLVENFLSKILVQYSISPKGLELWN